MSIFAKRHYEAIATVMQNAHPGGVVGDGMTGEMRVQWDETCRDMAEMFARDNPAFCIIRFMKACKPGANVRARS